MVLGRHAARPDHSMAPVAPGRETNVMRATILLAMSAVTLFLASCAGAPQKPLERVPGDYSYTREYVSWLIAKEMRKDDVQGVSIALVDDQRVVWAEGFGFADVLRKIPADPDTVYQVGSISKLFTVTSAMQLAEQGRLDLDQSVQTYLPGFVVANRLARPAPVTIRQLMTHHAGLPRDLLKGMWTPEPEPFTHVLDHLQGEYQVYPPDTVFSYSNVGMTLLGHVVQEVAGRDFVPHLEASLLQPLGMTNAYIAPTIRGRAHDSKGYRKGRDTPGTPLRDLPAGGLHASVADLSKFMMMVFADGRAKDRQIVQRETLREMMRPHNADVPLDLDFRVGLGWFLSGLGDINIYNAGPVVHHAGGTLLFHSQLILLPEHKLGVVVLGNSASARSVVDRVAVETLKLALESKTGITQPVPREWPATKNALSEDALRRFEGQYATIFGAAEIMRDGHRLQANVLGRTFSLAPYDEGWFGLRYRLFGFIPISLGELDRYAVRRESLSGREILVASDGHSRMLLGERVTPKAIPEVWQRRVGRYEIVNQGQDEQLIKEPSLLMKNGLLLMRVTVFHEEVPGELVVKPVSDTEAVLSGGLAGAGETIRVVEVNGVEMLRFSGYLFKCKAE